jgi:16S rRNA (guanine966-N2)-methyltransferase
VAPKGLTTRPTSDRVREALFSVLGGIAGASVLDLYAGTGALGIEAMSRGAVRTTFVENDPSALDAIRRNVETLSLRSVSNVVSSSVIRAARGLSSQGPFTLVFVDPPYANLAEAVRVLALLVNQKLCSPNVRVVLEHASRDAAPTLIGLTWRKTRRYGDTSVSFYFGSSDQTDSETLENGDIDTSTHEDVSSSNADG